MQAYQRRDAVGKSAFALLAVADSVRHRLDGREPFRQVPVAFYGVVLLCAACAYWLLQRSLIKAEGPDCLLARAVGGDWKGNLSPLINAAAIALAFVHPWISCALYIVVAVIWLPPRPANRTKNRAGGAAAGR